MNTSLLAAQTGHSHLRRLVVLRFVAIAAQLIALTLAHRFFSTDFNWMPMLGVVGFLTITNILTWWRTYRDIPVGNLELFLQLCIDVGVLTVLLYYGGGSTNPFVSLYLLPLVIASTTLPRIHTWSMAAITMTCYSLLMVWYVPLPHSGLVQHQNETAIQHLQHGQAANSVPAPESSSVLPDDTFNMHVLGMWLGFAISSVVVAYFVVEMARAVRIRDAQLTRVREETLRNERIVALGTQAAGAAHEMGTPLATMSVIIGEMRDECRTPDQSNNLGILDEQVRNCKRILDSLLSNAQDTGSEISLEIFIRNVLDEWQLLRPTIQYAFQTLGSTPSPQLSTEPALRSALLNLLNNAADASPKSMDIRLHWTNRQISLVIHDQGPGLTTEAAERAGSAYFTTKQEGRGLGLFLANATIERLGGTVRLFNRSEGGATTEVILPLSGSST